MIHVGFVLFLTFLLFPIARRLRNRVCWWDWICAILGLVAIGYGLAGGDDFIDRNTIPTQWDMVFGVILVVLVLEAARRSTGWIMPAVCLGFIAYAMAGPYLPAPWTHRGYDISRLTGHMYMTLEGIFGVAVDVSSSLIILFTIYGAFLQYSGAGKFFIDFSFAAMGGKPTGAGRDDRACLVPAWWTLGQRGSDDGNARHRGLSHARQSGLRQGRGRGAARRGWAGRDHLAAGAGRSGVPHRGVPQDLIPRCDPDGDDPDLSLLLRAVPDGRARRAQVRHARHPVRARRRPCGRSPGSSGSIPCRWWRSSSSC